MEAVSVLPFLLMIMSASALKSHHLCICKCRAALLHHLRLRRHPASQGQEVGWMSHCYESISDMLLAVFLTGLSVGLSQCLPDVLYLLTACLLLYLPALGLWNWCHICLSVCWWQDAHFLCLVNSPTHQTSSGCNPLVWFLFQSVL